MGSSHQRNANMVKPTFRELSTDEIAQLVEEVDTTRGWKSVYMGEAHRLKKSCRFKLHNELRDALSTFAERAVAARAEQLRSGDLKFFWKYISSHSGIIPGVKAFVVPSAVAHFNKRAVAKFGLSSQSDLKALYRKACSAGGLAMTVPEALDKFCTRSMNNLDKKSRKQILKVISKDQDLEQWLMDEMSVHFGEEVVMTIAEEIVHIKPIVGQLYSAARAWNKCGDDINKSIAHLEKRALDVHQMLFVGAAVEEMFPLSTSHITKSVPIDRRRSQHTSHKGEIRLRDMLMTVKSNQMLDAAIAEGGKQVWRWITE